MLISVMYHHVNSDRCSNHLKRLDEHIHYISRHFNSSFPSSVLPKKAICLVFDDGYYDFYRFIFPLLKKYNVKALLAVIPKYTLDDTDKTDDERLNYLHNDLFKQYQNATFCTYKELQEMIDSQLIQVVSHSYSHTNLLDEHVNLIEELQTSKQILEEKLNISVESFVYPFGKYNQAVLDETMKYYNYSFRIGNGINKDFSGVNNVIYRIDGDNLIDEKSLFSFKNMMRYRFKTWIKGIIGNKK